MPGGVRAFGGVFTAAVMAIIGLGSGVFNRGGRRIGRCGGAEAEQGKRSGEGRQKFRHEGSFAFSPDWRAGHFYSQHS